jgi:uncharacterized protein
MKAETQVPLHGPPSGLPLMRMQWRHLLFIHWRVPAENLRPLIPDSLEIEEFDGSAWVGLVPFTMRHVLPSIIPPLPIVGDVPRLSAFHECNVRTYVRPREFHGALAAGGNPRGLPGIWFFSLDAQSRAAVWGARTFFHLPYFYAKMKRDRRHDVIDYAVDRCDSPRAKLRCAWRVGETLPFSQPGDLTYFLTERYALYTIDSRRNLRCCRIWHGPWPLRRAELLSLDDELVRAAGIACDQSQPPLLHHADEINMRAWRLERL